MATATTNEAGHRLLRHPVLFSSLAAIFLIGVVTTASVCGTGHCGSRSTTTSTALEACSLVQCYLVNTDTREELPVLGETTYAIDIDTDSVYSIRCDPLEQEVDFLDFFLGDTEINREVNAPHYMNGNSGDTWIEPVWQLSECGDHSFRVSTESSLVEGRCTEEAFSLTATC